MNGANEGEDNKVADKHKMKCIVQQWFCLDYIGIANSLQHKINELWPQEVRSDEGEKGHGPW